MTRIDRRCVEYCARPQGRDVESGGMDLTCGALGPGTGGVCHDDGDVEYQSTGEGQIAG